MIIKNEALKPVIFQNLTILDYTADVNTSSSLAVITIPPGGRHVESWSKRSDKYYYVILGSVIFTLDGDKFTLSRGDCIVVLKGRHFSYENDTEEKTELILFHTPSFDIKSEVFIE